ncbi:MAG TPA: hypothetical protein VGP07_02895 [Polyangia bacterium]|jgi:purine-nucleoside phosphorylase
MPPSAASRTREILIVSAFAPELAPLARWLEGDGRALSRRLACLPVGIGLVDAAAGAAEAMARVHPELVIFIGTAGSYGGGPAIGEVAIARRLRLVSTAVLRKQGYLPGPMRQMTTADRALQGELLRAGRPNARAADVATPLAITRTRGLAARIASAASATVENLEAFAVARAAERGSARFAAILGIANQVGPAAHRQWVAHQAQATAAACAVASTWLEAISSV